MRIGTGGTEEGSPVNIGNCTTKGRIVLVNAVVHTAMLGTDQVVGALVDAPRVPIVALLA